MLVENQLVEVKWNNHTKKWYEEKGYHFTHNGDTFFVKAEDAHPNSQVTKIKARCDYCGRERLLSTQDYYKNTKLETIKYSCGAKGCASRKHEEYDYERKREQIQKFYELCKERGYKPVSTIDDYNLAGKSKLLFECSLHGVQEITLNAMQSGNGCKKCGRDSQASKRRLSVACVKHKIESVNNNILLNPNDYINNMTKNLKVLCGTCKKRVFITSLEQYTSQYHSRTRCEYCARSQSNSERIIQYYLEYYGYKYIYNYRFKDCRDKRPLPFDFYLPELNIAVEFDGEHHYKPIRGMKRFIYTKLHDAMKTQYCKWNNIDLLRIPYWERDNIEKILIDYLNIDIQSNPTKIKYIPNRKTA